MKIKLWGTRGSIPVPYTPVQLRDKFKSMLVRFYAEGYQDENDVQNFFEQAPLEFVGGYGGNTSCCEIKTESTQVIIDCGSGLRELGYEMMKGPCGQGKGQAHIFFTHFHWDHLTGLPFFTPIFIPGNEIHFYAVQPDLETIVRSMFKKPYFPVPFEGLASKIHFHLLKPREAIKFGDLYMAPYQLDHPDPCWGYKVTHNGNSFAYCVDTEATRTTREELGPDLPLYQDIKLMIFDAQYTLMEAIDKINWGHAAATLGLDIAIRERIPKVAFIHHDPAAHDEKIKEAEAQARRYYDSQKKQASRNRDEFFEVDWNFAPEGTVFEV